MQSSNYFLVLLTYSLPLTSFALNLPPVNAISANTLASGLSLSNSNLNPTCIEILNPPQPPLNPTACDAAIGPVCKKLTSPSEPPPINQWQWAGPPGGEEGCSLGFYLPSGAAAPSAADCVQTFKATSKECTNAPGKNAGTINVKSLPSLIFGDGVAIDPAEIMYIMAPQQLSR